MSSSVSMSYWSIFERNLVGLADFSGSKFQAIRTIHTVSMKKRNWASRSSSSVGISNLLNRPIPLDSSRKLTKSPLTQTVPFSTSPREKAWEGVEKSWVVFRSHNRRSQADNYGIGKPKTKQVTLCFPFIAQKPASSAVGTVMGHFC